MSETVITRFAPSPTGFLHIGGARTALFNWLYAKAMGGKMLLRIEDTDRARSSTEAIEAILDGLRWLELDWDDEPVYQFARASRHREIAEQLLADGKAYRCYSSPEELKAMRDKAREGSGAPGYDGTWRDKDEADAPQGVAPVIRFKAPQDGETIVEDRVQGQVIFANKDLDDFVLLRSDGSPTYMLSVVVDDHDMGITHVIRGDDHLTNAARQTQLFQALMWETPTYAHVPLIHGPDGAKLSKRHGALGVEAYREMGYLPVALRNYLVRLGWSHGDEEIISSADMVRWFNLEAIGRSAARFDFAKLENLNGHYLRSLPDEEIITNLKALLPHLANEHAYSESISDAQWSMLRQAMLGLKERAKTLVELLDSAAFLFAKRPLVPDEKAAKLLKDEGAMLSALLLGLQAVDPWRSEALEACVRAFAEQQERKLGKVAQPLRAALTGRSTSPGIFDVLEVLGRDEALGRIADQAGDGKSA